MVKTPTPFCNLVFHSAVSFAMRASSFLIIPLFSVWNSFLCCWSPVQKPLAFACILNIYVYAYILFLCV